MVSGFQHSANGRVDTLAAARGHLLVGGTFTTVNGDRTARMASLSPSTGRGDGFLNLSIAGSQVYNQQVSHGGTLDLVEGVFSSAGGLSRHQIFMLNVGGSRASVTGWTSPDFGVACTESFWARAAAWSPDDSTVYAGHHRLPRRGQQWGGALGSAPCCAGLPGDPGFRRAQVDQLHRL